MCTVYASALLMPVGRSDPSRNDPVLDIFEALQLYVKLQMLYAAQYLRWLE